MISPMRSATDPETPVSISSKITVGSCPERATSDLRLSISRDISPPEATFSTGWSGIRRLAVNRKRIVSAPSGRNSAAGAISIRRTADSMPSSASIPAICSSIRGAAAVRTRRQLARDPDSLGTQPLDLLPHLGNRLGTAFDIRQLRFVSGLQCEQFGNGSDSMLLLERIDAVQTGSYLFESPGISIDPVGAGSGLGSQILQIERRRVQAGIKFLGPGMNIRLCGRPTFRRS